MNEKTVPTELQRSSFIETIRKSSRMVDDKIKTLNIPPLFKNKKVLFGIGAGLILLIFFWLKPTAHVSNIPTFKVKKDKFLITVSESGELRAKNSVSVSAPRIRGNLKIVYLVPEGTYVKTGEAVVKFDPTEALTNLKDAEAKLEIALSEREKVVANHKAEMTRLESDLKSAGLSYELSKLNLEQMKFEAEIKQHVTRLLKTEKHEAYREYLEKSLKDVSQSHGGYFSQDNSEKDDKIEKEIEEILHDKESLLSLDNPRRFIFSKWTLREGWDNPNVFQICKLRSSGGKTSKLQEVGRGLRLPVNEFMQRVKNENFQLHYYVDFTEKDFVKELVEDINSKSLVEFDETKLTDDLIAQILDKYSNQFKDEEALLEHLDDLDAIKRNNDFKEGGLEKLKQQFPLVFAQGLKANKVRNAGDTKQKATMRLAKYAELKEMWETLNRKVILEYKIDSEEQFHALLKGYFAANLDSFKKTGSFTKKHTLIIENYLASQHVEHSIHEEVLPIQTMTYGEFLHELAISLKVNRNTLHQVFIELLQSTDKHLDINQYLSQSTIRSIRSGFNDYFFVHDKKR